jgi:hypothetical protein
MNLLAYFRSFAAKFFRRSQIEDDVEEELRSHIQHRADDLEHSGLNRTEAERRARIEFGGHARFKEPLHASFSRSGNRLTYEWSIARHCVEKANLNAWTSAAANSSLKSNISDTLHGRLKTRPK